MRHPVNASTPSVFSCAPHLVKVWTLSREVRSRLYTCDGYWDKIKRDEELASESTCHINWSYCNHYRHNAIEDKITFAMHCRLLYQFCTAKSGDVDFQGFSTLYFL